MNCYIDTWMAGQRKLTLLLMMQVSWLLYQAYIDVLYLCELKEILSFRMVILIFNNIAFTRKHWKEDLLAKIVLENQETFGIHRLKVVEISQVLDYLIWRSFLNSSYEYGNPTLCWAF